LILELRITEKILLHTNLAGLLVFTMLMRAEMLTPLTLGKVAQTPIRMKL
jgi:hypothetical protein